MASIDELLPDDLIADCLRKLGACDLLNACATAKRWHALQSEDMWRTLCASRWSEWPPYRLTTTREQWLEQNMASSSWRARYFFFERDRLRAVIKVHEISSLHWKFNFTPAAGGHGRQTLRQARFDGSHLIVAGYPPLPWSLSDEGLLSALANVHAASREVMALATAMGVGGSSSGGGSCSSAQGGVCDSTVAAASLSPQDRAGAVAWQEMDLGAKLEHLQGMDNAQLLEHLAAEASDLQRQLASMTQTLQIANFPPHHIERLDNGEWLIYNENVTLVSCQPDQECTYNKRGFLTVPEPADNAPGMVDQ